MYVHPGPFHYQLDVHDQQVNNSEGVQMPGVAPYLATAAIGAFFTTLASQTSQTEQVITALDSCRLW